MTQEEKARRYDEAIEISKKWRNAPNVNKIPTFANRVIEEIFPELKESEDERIREKLIDTFNFYDPAMNSPFLLGIDKKDIIAWLEKQGSITKLSDEEQNKFAKGVLTSCALSFIDYLDAHKYDGKMCVSNGVCEDIKNAFHNAMWDRLHRYYCKYIEKQGENCLVNFDEAEKEKNDFVSGQFIECRKSFDVFKEDNSYWFEYIGDDIYIGRSDNILNQRFHITPRQLYRLFTQQHCPKENNVNEEANAPIEYNNFDVLPGLYKCVHRMFDGTPEGRLLFEVDNVYKCLSKHDRAEFEVSYGHSVYLEDPVVRKHFIPFEKQDKQNTADKVEPKFHEGDWIISNDKKSTYQVIEVKRGIYVIRDNANNHEFHIDIESCERSGRLWNISDAKPGDVLVNDFYFIFIFKEISDDKHDWETAKCCYPATKKQRDLLFQKINEAGTYIGCRKEIVDTSDE